MPYEAYFKAASESLIIVDRQGRIMEANPRTERLFCYRQDELIGQPIELLLPERLRERHRKHVDGYFPEPRSRPMGIGKALIGRRKDGSEFPIEVSLTYARGTSRGNLVVAAITDVSERLALEHEARRAETLTSLGTIAAGVAHDLNNPLAIVLSRAELLLAMPGEALSPQMVHEDLTVMHRNAQRASRIVDQFLELSRHGSRTAAPVDMNALVQDVLLLIGGQMRKSGIKIEVALERTLPSVVGDPVALERVLINLLTNARDAMGKGGAVTIETVLATNRPETLRLSVADTGPGIHPEALGKIFDLLYTTKSSGTGLGLWLSRRIIQEHRGKIDVQSQLGKGTMFTITLPVRGAAVQRE